MDKYEYKLKLDQMKSMAAEGSYNTAAEIADSINWKKVKNVSALVKAGEIYEQAERYEDSKEVLLLAYDRSPIGRTIIYRLAEVAIKMGNFEEAQEYCDEFVEIAPHDNLKYVLRYNLSKAKGEGNQALIAILEEYKEQEYTEEWAYELAYLYHKEGMSEKCIEACDELILWFGDGPYVERALELKMIYQPLNKQQEEKYRQFRQRHAGVVEIRPEDELESGEIVTKPVQIPQVKVSAERFNTVNLQEELAKSMQQIIDATEKDTVDNSMDNIKKIVEEIPYLQIPHEKEETAEEQAEHIETDEEIDNSINNNFNEMLGEEHDGQMSLVVPEKSNVERQITGQLEIDDILAEWEKTKRAAEAALQEAKQRKLESAKARALQEAGDIMERLVDVIPKLDSGLTPKELLEQEYLQKQEDEESAAEEFAEEAMKKGKTVGHTLKGAGQIGLTAAEMMALTGASAENAKAWAGQQLDNMPVEEAGKLVASMNNYLQQEIDRLHTENNQIDERIAEAEAWPDSAIGTETQAAEEDVLPEIQLEPECYEDEKPEEAGDVSEEAGVAEDALTSEEAEEVLATDAPEEVEGLEAADAQEGVEGLEADAMKGVEAPVADVPDNVEIPAIDVPKGVEAPAADELDNVALSAIDSQEDAEGLEIPEVSATPDAAEDDIVLPEIQLEPELFEETQEEEHPAEQEKESVLPEIEEPNFEDESALGAPVFVELTQEQKEIFSYFVPIKGMKEQLCQALTGMADHLYNDKTSSRGNLIIQGDRGCGKTVLATDVVKVLQKEIDRPNGKIGKIEGATLNQKDIVQLLKKVAGGCLIIERAGEISRETAIKLSLLMENETSGLMVILEDTRRGIAKALAKDEGFASKFTEKLTIPIFTSDELVAFAKTYANEAGYNIEEMAVLALYNRISNIQRVDQGTTLIEVKEIVDAAISKVEKGGIKKAFSILTARRYDENDYIVLHEKDFEK